MTGHGAADRTESPDWSIVVGATGAVGGVVVDRLVDDGHRVMAVGRSEERLAELAARCTGPSQESDIVTLRLDLRDAGCGSGLVDHLDGGRVRLLAHLASAPLGGDVLATPDDVLAASFDVKVTGLVRLVRALNGHFASSARVVAVGGNLGFDPVPSASTAGMANAAQANLVRQLNRRLAPHGVTCHTVAPGPVDTARHRGLVENEAAATGRSVAEVMAAVTTAAPLGRLTTPEEVAWAISMLCHDEAAAMAGSTLLLDAGRRTSLP